MTGGERMEAEPRGIVLRRFDELRLAIMFLTRLPVGRIDKLPRFADSMWAFPVAGALHGGIVGAIFAGAAWAGWGAPIPALLAIVAGLLASGAFHEDGLADCADGFGGGTTRERKLEIMRDSRLGTYGTAALMLALALKVALLGSLGDPLRVVSASVALGALTRGLLPAALLLLPAAREDGAPAETAGPLSYSVAALSAGLGTASLLFLLPMADWRALAAVVLGMGAMLLIAWRHIGGLTGDVLGASQVVGEIAGLLALAAHV